ncbi:MAG: thiolase family protein [Acidobacteria bacterium]|nr:MAG: thiolase family protein [Acidobacteriota bacterium]
MPRRVAIVSTGQTKHRAKRLDVNIRELITEAVTRALEDADMSMKDIDAVMIGNMEPFEGFLFPELWAVEGWGGYLKPSVKFNTGGTVGTTTAIAAYYYVASGIYDVVLAIGFEKQSEGHTQTAITTVGDPIWERAIMAGAVGNFAVMASTYIHESGVTEEQAAKVAVKARRNACNNEYAHLQMPDITVEDVLKSRMLAYPVKLLDMCPQSDGACAVIFAEESRAKKLAVHPAWIKAVATAHEQQYMGDSPKRLAVMRSQIAASRRAYAYAGITNPRKELDVAEIYEVASFAELAMYENLGFCERGEGGKLIDAGVTEMTGELPVNPSGGVLSTNPIGATALIRVAEAALQVMGKAGKHQIDGVRTALATGYGGNAWTDVMILSRDL